MILEPKKIKSVTISIPPTPFYLPWIDRNRCLNVSFLFFLMLSFKSTFSLFSFILINRLFSFSSLFAIRVMSSAYLRLLILFLAILIPVCDSSKLYSHPCTHFTWHSAYELNKQSDNIQPWHTSLPNFEPVIPCPVLTELDSSCFLTCTQVSQETGKVVW